MPNGFAYLMLFGWPVVALVLFRTLPLPKALIWTMLGGYLLLPSNFGVKLPMIPEIDKTLVPTASALILCLIYAPRPARVPGGERGGRGGPPRAAATAAAPRGRALIVGLLAVLMGAPFLTVLLNPEPIVVGPIVIPGLRLYDAFSMVSSAVVPIIPFLLAWRYLATPEAHRLILQAFVLAALVYSLPALFEVRMSPQLNRWIYGYFPHYFIQHIRDGGFRPIVFLNHGLMVGIFLCMAILAGLALWREALREGRPASGWLFAVIWLVGTLILAKTLGALTITLIIAPFVVLTGQRMQILVAAIIAVIVLFYPMLRGAGFIPVEKVYEISLSISEERAQSLKYRLDNEDALLAHANRKPLSGWGSWGRNQLYDPYTGEMTSVTDGAWVILIGIYGWTGYIAHFGLLTFPILLYARRRRRLGPSLVTPGLMLLLAATLIDLLPNAGLPPYVWMLAGAMTGFVLRPAEDATPAADQHPPAPTEAGTARPSWLAPPVGPRAGRQPRQSGRRPQYQER